ncbi:Uncharacterized protein SCF082_LOCUS10527, partial [Durusdinium trenchii]
VDEDAASHWVPTLAARMLCLELELEQPQHAEGGVVRVTMWRNGEPGREVHDGKACIDLANVPLAGSQEKVALALEVEPDQLGGPLVFEEVVLIFSFEDETSTEARRESAVIVRFVKSEDAEEASAHTRESDVPPWLRRRSTPATPLRVWFFNVDTDHRLCEARQGYQDCISVADRNVWLRLAWSVTRSKVAERFGLVRFTPASDQREIRDNFVRSFHTFVKALLRANDAEEAPYWVSRQLENTTPKIVPQSRTSASSRRKESLELVEINPEADVNVPLEFLVLLEPAFAASCLPSLLEILSMECEFATAGSFSQIDQEHFFTKLLEDRSNLLVLFVVVLARVTDDRLAHPRGLLPGILEELALAASDAILLSFMRVLLRIVEASQASVQAFVWTPAYSRASSAFGSGPSAWSQRSSEVDGSVAGGQGDITNVVLAWCTTALVAVQKSVAQRHSPGASQGGMASSTLLGQPLWRPPTSGVLSVSSLIPIASVQEDWSVVLGESLTFLMRTCPLLLSFKAVVRLYPACLVVVDPTRVARDLLRLFKRTHHALVEAGDSNVTGSLDFVLGCMAHMYGRLDGGSLWAQEIMPSAQQWTQLSLLRQVVQIATFAASTRAADFCDMGDGFDVLVESLFDRLSTMHERHVPHKFDLGPMTPEWALHQSWDLVVQLVALTCKRGFPVHPATLSMVHLFARQGSLGKQERGWSMLEDKVTGIEGEQARLQVVDHIFNAAVLHLSNPDVQFHRLGEAEMMTIASRLFDLLEDTRMALGRDAKPIWVSALKFLLYTARYWENAELARWSLVKLDNLVSQHFASHPTSPQSSRQLFSFQFDAPWFVSLIVQGLVQVCHTIGVADTILDAAILCLNRFLSDQSSRLSAEMECKLAAFRLAHVSGSREGASLISSSASSDSGEEQRHLGTAHESPLSLKALDRWILAMEDACVDKTLADRLFALRALGSALRHEPKSPLLYYDAVLNLLGPENQLWISPWVSPPVHLVLRRRSGAARRVAAATARLAVPSEGDVTAEIRVLRRALELQRQGISCSGSGHTAAHLYKDAVFAHLVVVQLQVQLQLCDALDDMGKDLFVRDAEEVIDQLLQLAKVTENHLWARLAAFHVALVEDALKEPVSDLWQAVAHCPSVIPDLRKAEALLGFTDVFVSRPLGYLGDSKQWFVAPASALDHSLGSFAEQLEADAEALRFQPLSMSGSSEAMPFQLPCSREFHPSSKGRFLFTGHQTAEGWVAFARSVENGMDKALRIELRSGGRKGEHERLGVGALLLPETIRNVEARHVGRKEACREMLVLVTTSLRSCLENEVWLPKFDSHEAALLSRNVLHRVIVADLRPKTRR